MDSKFPKVNEEDTVQIAAESIGTKAPSPFAFDRLGAILHGRVEPRLKALEEQGDLQERSKEAVLAAARRAAKASADVLQKLASDPDGPLVLQAKMRIDSAPPSIATYERLERELEALSRRS